MDRDYAIFKIPFINVVDKIFVKVRDLTYRYMPNQMTLFPMETEQYDNWLMCELLNNCIAHTNYQLGSRIYANEFEDRPQFTNPGDLFRRKLRMCWMQAIARHFIETNCWQNLWWHFK